jgi:hypothetical protein
MRFGGSRLFRRWPDGQHWAGGGADYGIRDAAYDQMAETGPTTRRHHDEVHVFCLGRLDDLLKQGANDHRTSHLDFRLLCLRQNLGQLSAGLPLQIVQQVRAHG